MRPALLILAAAHLQHCNALAAPSPKPALPELRMNVKDSGKKGLGCYAAEDRSKGQWVCDYQGELIDFAQRAVRYVSDEPEYLFHLGGGAVAGSHVYIDAVANHARPEDDRAGADRRLRADGRRAVDRRRRRDARVGRDARLTISEAHGRRVAARVVPEALVAPQSHTSPLHRGARLAQGLADGVADVGGEGGHF